MKTNDIEKKKCQAQKRTLQLTFSFGFKELILSSLCISLTLKPSSIGYVSVTYLI